MTYGFLYNFSTNCLDLRCVSLKMLMMFLHTKRYMYIRKHFRNGILRRLFSFFCLFSYWEIQVSLITVRNRDNSLHLNDTVIRMAWELCILRNTEEWHRYLVISRLIVDTTLIDSNGRLTVHTFFLVSNIHR